MLPSAVTHDFVSFFDQNVKENPGKSTLRFNILEPVNNVKICMHLTDRGFSMNEEMASYLLENPDIDVHVDVVSGAN